MRRRILTGLALGIAATALVPVMSLDHFIFFPDRHVAPPPPGVVERWLTTADGVRLHAWHAVAPDRAPTLVWSHGNAGNIAGRAPVLQALAARGLGVLAYDYRGYGKSTGTPSEAGVYRDVEAAYDSVARPGVRLVAFGESLRGAVSIHLVTVRPCAAIVAVSTFTTMRDVARSHYGVAGLLLAVPSIRSVGSATSTSRSWSRMATRTRWCRIRSAKRCSPPPPNPSGFSVSRAHTTTTCSSRWRCSTPSPTSRGLRHNDAGPVECL